MTAREELRELRATIEALTGRRPVSENVVHLRRRLAMLRDERPPPSSAVVPWYGTAIDKVLGEERCAIVYAMAGGAISFGDVVRRAVDEYAVKQGYGAHVERAKKGRAP